MGTLELSVTSQKAIRAIYDHGVLLVFPIQNRKEPLSLWHVLYPKTKMRWDWTDEGDDRVAQLWHLRERLSRSGEVVYAKWYQGRATFFSPDFFSALLRFLNLKRSHEHLERTQARAILNFLEESSPRSTKDIKKAIKAAIEGSEKAFQAGLKELWNRLLIVGYGEVDDGAFPSLAVGATHLMFENLWRLSGKLSARKCEEIFGAYLPVDSLFLKFAYKVWSQQKGGAEKHVERRSIRYEDLVK